MNTQPADATPQKWQALLVQKLMTIGGVVEMYMGDREERPEPDAIDSNLRMLSFELSRRTWGFCHSIIGTSTLRWRLDDEMFPERSGEATWARLFTADRTMWLNQAVGLLGTNADWKFETCTWVRGMPVHFEKFQLTVPFIIDGAETYQGPPPMPEKRAHVTKPRIELPGDPVHDSDPAAQGKYADEGPDTQ